ncbi:hypothetical protein RB195_014966 [Necator americanus]|uniref:Uncharacterized protein n=1 Tax=Necator americanus TaxID=51031 RepID=A0ABR1E2G2_NECAM
MSFIGVAQSVRSPALTGRPMVRNRTDVNQALHHLEGDRLVPGLSGRDVVKKTKNTWLRAYLFNTTVLPASSYASESLAFCKQKEDVVGATDRSDERPGASRFTQTKEAIRSSNLRRRQKNRAGTAYAKEDKIGWTA